jgi:hypothetical protein
MPLFGLGIAAVNFQYIWGWIFSLFSNQSCIHAFSVQVCSAFIMHDTKNQIYVSPEMKLRGLIPNSYIHIWRQQNRQTDLGNINISFTGT